MKIIVATALFCAMPLVAQAQKTTSSPPITSVAMEQFECFWNSCPHYVVAVNIDGSANYIGLAVAKKKGGVTLKLPATAFGRIVKEINRIHYFDLKKSYASEADGCKSVRSDQSSVSFFVTRGDETKVVDLYYGCDLPGVSDKLAKLAAMIDEVTGVRPLLGRGE